jgi:hypothetical protein
MSEDELRVIEERWEKATPGKWAVEQTCCEENVFFTVENDAFSPFILTDEDREAIAHARTDIPALVAEVRRLRGFLSGLDYRALPDNYKHNLQRAEETAAEALALLEERGKLHRDLELENEKLQADNARHCAENERLSIELCRIRSEVQAYASYDLDDPKTRRRALHELLVNL